MRAARALLLALALPLPAAAATGESGTLDPAALGGATAPLLGALNHVRVKHERACLSGIRAFVNVYVDPNKGSPRPDPNCHAGAYNRFRYYFYSPDKPKRIIVETYQPIGSGPICMAPRYGYFDSSYPGDTEDRIDDVRSTCIADFDVDTGRALGVAAENGLPLGTLSAYELLLRFAETRAEPDWKDKLLRGKTFWAVSLGEKSSRLEYLVDARTGAFLKSRPRRKE